MLLFFGPGGRRGEKKKKNKKDKKEQLDVSLNQFNTDFFFIHNWKNNK